MLDLKITGGRLFDGTGREPVAADVGVLRDRIEAVGDLSLAEARECVDARGLCVCPGFIDVHSHSDSYILIEPSAASKIFQGITTEIVGNCGASAAPRVGEYRMPSDWRDKKYPGPWSSVAEYRALVDSVNPAVNIRLLIGHNSLRAGVIGYDAREATAEEIEKMSALLADSLDQGGAGFSSGLIYAPGLFATREEVVALARVAAGRGKLYTSHMRSEGARLLEALDETLEIGRRSGARVEVSHLKTSGRKNWHLVDSALDKIRAAQREGLAVAADRYPYIAACTDLDVILPDWASGGGTDETLRRLRDPATRSKIRDELTRHRDAQYWESVTIGSTHNPANAAFQGNPLVQVAASLDMEPVDAALHLMDTDALHTAAIFFGMSEENMWKILAEPYVMIGSDASLRAPQGPLSHDHPHPRAYGTFPRVLRAALDGKTVPLAEAIRKMTSLPAGQFGLADRGIIERGRKADIVVFDPSAVRDKATYEQPHQLAEGVRALVVNGVPTLRDGRETGKRGGRFV
ncbi:MAG: D-aminoacylase [Verrucomicrobia bacterium ADurb.Bin345]|nr:MAG: D-aminoacylase [Verrucomicrobia bacterium ADurb.Bin345]